MTGNREKYKFDNGYEAGKAVKMILRSLWSTPSMQDKMPKYSYEPLMMLQDFVEKHGWEDVEGV